MSKDNPAVSENLIAAAIEAAEEIRDPLDGLVEKTAIDPGAPFASDALEQLATLMKEDRAAFEALRAQLRKAGCRVTALDQALAEENGDTGRRGPTQADILIELAQSAELFHAPDRTGFADLDINGHRETWPIRAKGFRHWLARRFFEETRGAPSSEALQSALNVIEAKAHFDAPERLVHVRAGGLDGRLYLDLCDETWRAVEVDVTGWRVIDNPPVRFRRAAGMQSLPMPTSGGSVETLRAFLNVQTDTDFVLVVAWLLACLRNRGPYPVIVLSGEQGSAKSFFSAILRALLDPNTASLRALPREDRKPVRKRTLRGFASVKLPNGLVITDVVIGESSGKQWAILPSKAMIDRDGQLMRDAGGKIRYSPVIEWGTPALREEFSRRIAAIVVRHWPDAFAAVAAP